MTIRKHERNNDAFFMLIVVSICVTFFLFFAIIKYTSNEYSMNKEYFHKVLLQLNKDYHVEQENGIILLKDNSIKNINDILLEIEEIITSTDGTIHDYRINKGADSIKLSLFIKSNQDNDSLIKIIVLKEIFKNDIENIEVPSIKIEDTDVGPEICIILDDAGYKNPLIEKFVRLPIKLGIAVFPFLKDSLRTSTLIHKYDKEVMLHMPMEPENYKKRNIRLFKNEILVNMSKDKIISTIEDMLKTVQYVAGVNNHQGSRATCDRRVMKIVLKKLKEEGLFFIDSMTSSKSVVKQTAQDVQINYSSRDVFLDNVNEYNYIKKQMDELIRIALIKGKAVGIGHINNINTYNVIRDYISVFKSKGIILVYPSEILNKFSYKEVTKNVKENIINFY